MAAKLSVLKVEKNPLSSKARQLQLVHYRATLARYLATLVWVKGLATTCSYVHYTSPAYALLYNQRYSDGVVH